MKTQLVAGNWKMHTTRAEALELVGALCNQVVPDANVRVAVCPPFPYLEAVGRAISGSPIQLGAQNLHPEQRGAFTGEVSAAMLVDLGCRYVIVGHSERRHLLAETDEFIHRKVVAALAAGLTPIVCVGELIGQREQGETMAVVTRQVSAAFADLAADAATRVVIAYEPVWAIGTGRTATPEQAEEVHALIRGVLSERYDSRVSAGILILYGGSVKGSNAGALLSQPNVDGALVGGASLQADEFLRIISASRAAARA